MRHPSPELAPVGPFTEDERKSRIKGGVYRAASCEHFCPQCGQFSGVSEGVANGILRRAVCRLRHLNSGMSRIYTNNKGIFEGLQGRSKKNGRKE